MFLDPSKRIIDVLVDRSLEKPDFVKHALVDEFPKVLTDAECDEDAVADGQVVEDGDQDLDEKGVGRKEKVWRG